MLHAFHNSSLFQIFRCKGHRVCFCATILILGAAAWSNAFVFRNLSFNLDSHAKKLRLGLVGNAIKYRGPEIPKIHVGAERQMNAWIFKVADNGVGFEPEYADEI